MALREILKVDTSSAEHSKLNKYHESNNATSAPKTEEMNYSKPTSLLSDAEKFADFKKAIFSTATEKHKIEHDEEDVTNSKKAKHDTENEEASSVKVQPSLI